jgi:hypothetical protein
MNTEEEVLFVKLQHKLVNVDWNKFKTDIVTDSFYSETRKGGGYFYSLKNLPEFLALHKGMFKIMPHIIRYCEFTGSDLVTPHRDKDISVSLNLYLETDNATTIYYKELNSDLSHTNYKNIQPHISPLENLVEVNRFIAEPNDLYLLNVNEIHGILKTTTSPRTMITYRWAKYSFNQILHSLNL